MSRLLNEWRERKDREDEVLHEQLRGAMLGGRVQVYTDPRVLDFQGSPVHQHWDHLLPLTGLMTMALIILLATNVVVGIVVMTLCTLAHLFGSKYYIGWRLKMRAVGYLAEDVTKFQTLWQLGGVALVIQGSNEAPCLAPKGDWRKFIRRNLGEGEAKKPDALVNAPVPVFPQPVVSQPIFETPEPEPEPQAELLSPDLASYFDEVIPPEPEPEPEPSPRPPLPSVPRPADGIELAPPRRTTPKPGDRWTSMAEEEAGPPHDEVVPPSPRS